MTELPAQKRIVLVVEDDPIVRQLVVELLSAEADFDVHGAVGGTEVLKLLTTLVPHVVLLDLALPGMDGVELAEWFKADARMRDVPLIGITALGPAAGVRHEAIAAGCRTVLDKPIDADLLVRTIRSALII
ncbi:MAG TPA: response regulator [Chloroflexota bacterium]|nr:response regulator [Chloroflexota bacterium]